MLYSIKMRAARAGVHTSGAEKIVPGASVPRVAALLAERAAARKARNWAESDRIRDALKAAGWEVKDTPDGQKARRL